MGGGGADHGHGAEGGHGDFRAKVWSMSGGPYCRPKHWRRNTAIAMFGVFLICIPIAMKSAELELLVLLIILTSPPATATVTQFVAPFSIILEQLHMLQNAVAQTSSGRSC
ncbi:hypothetical protein D5086_004941 [Populus alba]|uniref:Uncharacterized protein n=1 Tax=Populus alba TaxID=43335 RepID=A0ACC4CT77_POPAL